MTEKPTGLFSIGGGYSSQDGVLGTLDLSQRNFLGKGWEVFLRLRGGENLQTGTIGFTEPWLFDRPLAAGFDIFNTRRILPDYTVNSLGGDIRLGHPIGEYSRWNAMYRVSQDDISDVNALGSPELLSEEGTHLTSLVGLSLQPRHPRQRLRPDPGQHGVDRPGLRGGGLRRALRPERRSPRPTSSRRPGWITC